MRPPAACEPPPRCCTVRTARARWRWSPARTTAWTWCEAAWPTKRTWTRSGTTSSVSRCERRRLQHPGAFSWTPPRPLNHRSFVLCLASICLISHHFGANNSPVFIIKLPVIELNALIISRWLLLVSGGLKALKLKNFIVESRVETSLLLKWWNCKGQGGATCFVCHKVSEHLCKHQPTQVSCQHWSDVLSSDRSLICRGFFHLVVAFGNNTPPWVFRRHAESGRQARRPV